MLGQTGRVTIRGAGTDGSLQGNLEAEGLITCPPSSCHPRRVVSALGPAGHIIGSTPGEGTLSLCVWGIRSEQGHWASHAAMAGLTLWGMALLVKRTS